MGEKICYLANGKEMSEVIEVESYVKPRGVVVVERLDIC